jgi:hypothetical protein
MRQDWFACVRLRPRETEAIKQMTDSQCLRLNVSPCGAGPQTHVGRYFLQILTCSYFRTEKWLRGGCGFCRFSPFSAELSC